MAKRANGRKLRNFLINPRYQAKYIFWISLTGLTLVIGNASVFYYYISQNYKILVDMSPMEDDVKVQLHRELARIVLLLGSFSLVFVFVVSVIGLLYSHRTAGPLYHFKRVFKAIREGKLDARVHLRPKDDFREVADEFNLMVDSLVSRITPRKGP
jgi:methyl-accepting chemotaxis protein